MQRLIDVEPKEVFKYFEEISQIPHGSGNMEAISQYCVDFAKEHNLKYIKDSANNVVIFKEGTNEGTEPIILQGHIDMVCQKDEKVEINFEKDGIDVFVDGDFIKAKGTTLGADNGIAVAMIMAILADKKLSHPPIEAVFTTDEEIGMIGASKLDISVLKGKRMINIDSEEESTLTVSCAGGSDVKITIPITKVSKNGTKLSMRIKGLQGGHSGIEIDKGRVNANILMGRILDKINKTQDFDIIKIDGGTKRNAIPLDCEVSLLSPNCSSLINDINEYFCIIKEEIKDAEPNCLLELVVQNTGEFEVLDKKDRDKLIYMLIATPNGVINMSRAIDGLVETSLNLGVLSTNKDEILMQYALRSNKKSALDALEQRLVSFANYNNLNAEKSGRYEPWEYKENSSLRDLYIEVYKEKFGKKPNVEAIHAGLECAVFSANIAGLDAIAIGPDILNAHTTGEKLSISSTKKIFEVLCVILGKLK